MDPCGKKYNRVGRALRRSARFHARRGAAVVEMAVVTPLLLAIMAGTMHFGYLFMVQNTITNATREAARVGVLQGATTGDIQTRFEESVAPMGLTSGDYALTITPGTEQNPVVTVKVQVPYDNVSLFGDWLGLGRDYIGAVASMRMEGVN